jgi:hypothetical protein
MPPLPDPTFFAMSDVPRTSSDSLRDYASRRLVDACDAQAARAEAHRFAVAARDAMKLTRAIEQQRMVRFYHRRYLDFIAEAKAYAAQADRLDTERAAQRDRLVSVDAREAAE